MTKYMLNKHENLSSNSQHPHKNWACCHPSVTPLLGGKQREEDHRDSLASQPKKLVHFRNAISDRVMLSQEIQRRATSKGLQCQLLASTCIMCMYYTHIHTGTHKHMHTQELQDLQEFLLGFLDPRANDKHIG